MVIVPRIPLVPVIMLIVRMVVFALTLMMVLRAKHQEKIEGKDDEGVLCSDGTRH